MKMFMVQCQKWEPNIRSSHKLIGFEDRQAIKEPIKLRTVYASGLFYYDDIDEQTKLPEPPTPIMATGRAYVDLIFHTNDDKVQSDDPHGSWAFLDNKKTALEVTISYPASFFDWAMDILRRSEGDESRLLINAFIEEPKKGIPSLDSLDAFSRLSDGKLDHIYLSAGPRRLKSLEQM